MNICFFSSVTYWHGLKGGMENFGKILLEGLSKRGHEITVISSRHPSGKDYEVIGNIHLFYLPHTKFSSVRHGWTRESRKKIIALSKTSRFDVICAQQPIFPPISQEIRSSTPIITFIQGHGGWMLLSEFNRFIYLKRQSKAFVKSVATFLYYYLWWELPNFWLSDLIVTPAAEVTSSLPKWFFLKSYKVKTIYNGVNTNHFKPDQTAKQRIIQKYPQLAGQKIVLFMSHVTPQKGLHLLLKVLPALLARGNNVSLFVVGGGDFLAEAKEMAVHLRISERVIFSGMVDIEALPDHINAADVFVLPTLRREGLPLSILEAMACKIPVIASDIGGNASAVKNGNGILIPPGDIIKLEESIHLLLNDKALANRLAENGYQSAIDTFSEKKMIDQFELLMKDALVMKRRS
ncbi:MAG TPA: glycosyltransferase family 4 protein [Syntrophales bacterium]|nr:glycosyltransferase family 4 protein [Syntrophales bacterium]